MSGAWPDEQERREGRPQYPRSAAQEPKKCRVATLPLEWPTHQEPSRPVHEVEQWEDLPIPECCRPKQSTQRDTKQRR